MSSELAWFKSSYSNTSGGECVEIAKCPDVVHIRDSKDRDGPQLTFAPAAWAEFIAFAARQAHP